MKGKIMSLLNRILLYLNLQRMSPTTALAVVPPQLSGRWTRVVDKDSVVQWFEHTCACETTRKFAPNEINRQNNRVCTCGEFNLKQSLAAGAVANKSVTKEAAPSRTMQTIGEQSTSDIYKWSDCDPGYSGLF
jgi:hypothetical protein